MTKEEFKMRWERSFECNKIKTLAFRKPLDELRYDVVNRQQKIAKKKYSKTDKFKTTQKRYQQSEKGKAKSKRYLQTEQGKASQKRYRQTETFREHMKLYMREYRERKKQCQLKENTAC